MFQQSNPQEFTMPQTGIAPTFFGKVMSAFGLAILVSCVGVWFSFNYLLEYFMQNQALIWIVFIAELVLIFTSRSWSTKKPLNYWLFSLFALLTGIVISPLLFVATVVGGTGIVIKALLATFLTFTAAGIIGWTTQKSLEGIGGFLMMALIGMLIVGVIGIFIPWGTQFEMIYAGIGVILFSAFAVFDFNRIKRFPEDRYIDAAMHLYLDMFNLFIFILRLLMASRN